MTQPKGMELTKGSKSRLEILEETKFGENGVELRNMAQAKLWANEIVSSELCPKGLKTEGDVLLAAQTGMELGFSAVRSLQACHVINGKVSLSGEAALALLRNPKVTNLCEVGCRGDSKDDWVGFARTRRQGEDQVYETTFSWQEALLAGLTQPTKWKAGGKRGERMPDPEAPWARYPKRMLMWRAVGFHTRDYFSDVMNGLVISEEARDTVDSKRPPPRDVTPPEGLRTGRTDPLVGGLTGDPGGHEDEVVDAEFSEVDPPNDQRSNTPEGDCDYEIDPDTGEVIPDEVGLEFEEDPL